MFQLEGSLTKRYEKDKAGAIIRNKIANGEPFGKECFMFNLPDKKDHSCHCIEVDASVTEPTDPRVKKFIYTLVEKGERNPSVIGKLVENYVVNELKETDRLKKRFWPDRRHLRNIIYGCKAKLVKSKIDQEKNTDTQSPTQQSFETNIYFKPCSLNTVNDQSDSEECETEKYLKEIRKRHHSNACRSTIQSILSTLVYLDEDKLETVEKSLENLVTKLSKVVKTRKLPIKHPLPTLSSNHLNQKKETDMTKGSKLGVESTETSSLKRKQITKLNLVKQEKEEPLACPTLSPTLTISQSEANCSSISSSQTDSTPSCQPALTFVQPPNSLKKLTLSRPIVLQVKANCSSTSSSQSDSTSTCQPALPSVQTPNSVKTLTLSRPIILQLKASCSSKSSAESNSTSTHQSALPILKLPNSIKKQILSSPIKILQYKPTCSSKLSAQSDSTPTHQSAAPLS